MPAYSFQKRFVPMVLDRTKRQTIRAKRKYQVKVGDTLYLYQGLRTKSCKKLSQEVCTDVKDIMILVTGVYVEGKLLLEDEEYDALARADGFKDFDEMFDWFSKTHGGLFKGDIIYW